MEWRDIIYIERDWKVQMKKHELSVGWNRYSWNMRCDKIHNSEYLG